jgi:hypothetical protein
LVKVLRDERISDGRYEDVPWDGTNKYDAHVASGVYVFFFTTRYKTWLAKILIVR